MGPQTATLTLADPATVRVARLPLSALFNQGTSPSLYVVGAGGEVVLTVDCVAVAHARIERTVPLVFSMSGETFDVGVDTGSPVGPYPHGFPCTAEIHGVTLERLSAPGAAVDAAVRAGLLQAGLRTQ